MMAGGGALPAWTTMEAVGISQELQAELEPAFSREQARTAWAAATASFTTSAGPAQPASAPSITTRTTKRLGFKRGDVVREGGLEPPRAIMLTRPST